MNHSMVRNLLVLLLTLCLPSMAFATDFTDVSMKVDGMKVTMNNGKLLVTIGSNGRVSSYKFNQSKELLGSSGIYFDYTTAQGNKSLSPTKVKVVKNTPEICEVLYSGASGNTLFEQGYIMRKTGKPWLSILLASLVFGIFHMNPVQIAYASMLGVVLGWIYYRTGSLLSVIVGHVLNNSMATIVMLTLSDVDVSAAQSVSSEIFSFVFFALLSLFFAWKLNRSLPPAGKRDACVDLETVN